jgi:hypothetical protein
MKEFSMTITLSVGDCLLGAAGRLTSLLEQTPDATAIAEPTSWTVAETAAHVLAELSDHADLAESGREPGLPDGPAWKKGRQANAEQLQRFPERDLHRIAAQLVPAAQRAVDALRGHEGLVWSTNGLLWTGEQTLQLLLGEQLVHGLDIARAAGLPWEISPRDALEVAKGSLALLPDYLTPRDDAARRLSYEIRLRGGPSYRFDVVGDSATVGPAAGKVDCVVSADPVAFVKVGYGRANPALAALTGKMVAFGRKPWLGLSFGSLLAAP